MLVYYLVLSAITLMFFLFLAWLRKFIFGLSLKLIFMLVFWVYLVSSFLPGLMSFISPPIAFLGAFFLTLLGSYHILGKMPVEDRRETVSTSCKVGVELKPLKPAKQVNAKEERIPEVLLPSLREVSLQVYNKAAPVAFMLPQELLNVPKDFFVCHSTRKNEQLFLLAESIKAQRKEAVLLPEQCFDFQGLINNAFHAKDEKNFSLAVNLFKKALSQTTDVSLKCMIYTEFVFIYKEMGKYLEAAGLIEGFLLENDSSLSHSLRLHFEKVVQHLLVLDELLKKAEHPDLPFSQVPNLIKIKAEKIFQD